METLLNQFLHIYFWVFIAVGILGLIINYNKKDTEYKTSLSFWSVVSVTIWIISFNY